MIKTQKWNNNDFEHGVPDFLQRSLSSENNTTLLHDWENRINRCVNGAFDVKIQRTFITCHGSENTSPEITRCDFCVCLYFFVCHGICFVICSFMFVMEFDDVFTRSLSVPNYKHVGTTGQLQAVLKKPSPVQDRTPVSPTELHKSCCLLRSCTAPLMKQSSDSLSYDISPTVEVNHRSRSRGCDEVNHGDQGLAVINGNQMLLPLNPVTGELTSIGSLQHYMGQCTECVFFRNPERSCKKGLACPYCHIPHIQPKNQKQKSMPKRYFGTEKSGRWCHKSYYRRSHYDVS
eukprot:GHVL01010587.1.p1 GENE.GHVL01010587.1~~GHVL01010587.1.p1  ORF type:complete len:290 (+),score=29.73 GHVL01010587.1:104-973(+)